MNSAIQATLDTAGLDEREAKVLDFIQAKKDAKEKIDGMAAFKASSTHQNAMALKAAEDGKSVCIDTVLGKIYQNALPYNDPDKNLSPSDVGGEIHNFIAKRTDGKPTEYYVREALKRTNSGVLKTIVTEAEKACSKAISYKKKNNIGHIDVMSLNYDPAAMNDSVDAITGKLSGDEISEIIQNNVANAINDEKQKAAAEDQYKTDIQDTLAADDKVMDDASMESTMAKITNFKSCRQPKVYQPSLFEAVMMNKAEKMDGADPSAIFTEAVHEYTKLAMLKALKLEDFNLQSVKEMAYDYINGKY